MPPPLPGPGQPELTTPLPLGPPPGYGPGYPPGAGPVPAAPGSERPRAARLSGWGWLLICVLAIALGFAGGFAGAEFAGDDGAASPVISLAERTAPPLDADNASIAAVAAEVLPSTVQIIAEYDGRALGATGSGFVLDTEGHVITNNHVVAEAADDDGPIDVIDQAGEHHAATVVGRSAVYDLAVLEIEDAGDLAPIAVGSAQQILVGETVVAFGSPLGLSATVTSGIVSALERPVTVGDGDDSSYINAVQTDAAINPGNSGGPLVNLQGQVIGVNSAIASLGAGPGSDEGGSIGVGFAIPIEQVLITSDQILRTGEALYPVIGVNVRGTDDLSGATVESINSGSPASDSRLRVGDLITAVDGKMVSGSSDVVVAVRSHQPGETVTLTVERGGRTLRIEVELEARVG